MTGSSSLAAAEQARVAGDLVRAEAILRAHVRRKPGDAQAYSQLGVILLQAGKVDQAELMLRRAISLAPADPGYGGVLAASLLARGRLAEALTLLDRVPAGHPHAETALFNRAVALDGLNRLTEARDQYRALIDRFGNDSRYVLGLNDVRFRLGEVAEACEGLRACLRSAPGDRAVLSLLCMMSLYDDVSPAERTLGYHMAAARATADFDLQGVKPRSPHELKWFDPDPSRRLRVGFISPDLRDHAVARFLEPLLSHLDRARVELFCYSCFGSGDRVSRSMRQQVGEDHWRDLWRLDSHTAAAAVEADQLDVLVELGGLSALSRIDVLSRRLAPLQVSAIGYPHATCFASIDGWIVDSVTNPSDVPSPIRPTSTLASAQELWRLDPCCLCYQPPMNAPDLAPRVPGGPIRFGSFNNICKWSPMCVGLWADVLRSVPDSVMVLKAAAFAYPEVRERTLVRFAGRGIPAHRVELLDHAPTGSDHLLCYSRIDIALDTFPYQGVTTTCEALLMGVPVVTLAGDSHVSRIGASLLHAAGLGEYVAANAAEYAAIAVSLATDATRLRELHSSLRSRLLSSRLCDAPGYSRRWERLIRDRWRTLCAAQT
ncbi:MAG: tetratricopeptide repeat protein [Planctomycetes bacterium]|nr:tetratricopeptide repeat protein [Planctomycetota bacterium]